jgi:hypothetical protein
MWVVNIGNIHFKTANEKQTLDENEGTILDVYERYNLAMDSVGLHYVWLDTVDQRSINVLENIRLNLSMAFKSIEKSIVLIGTQ